MTVGTTISTVTIEGNGVTTTFSYDFIMPNAGYAVVMTTDGSGVETIIPASQYLITGIGDPSGGTVTYPLPGPIDNPNLFGSPLPAGSTITISRFVPYVQSTSVSNQGPTFASVEAALDLLEMQIQQLNDQLAPVATSTTFGIVKPDNTTVTISNGVLSASLSGGGSVASGTTGSLAYYATTGTQVSGLPTGNNGVLVTGNTGTPSISATLPTQVQQNISELGTVTVGTWEGSVIDPPFLPIATVSTFGVMRPDNSSITIAGGIISAISGTATVKSVGLSVPSIFSVSGSPITTSGTISVTLNTQSANLVFAGPSTGAAASPSFRSLVSGDLPLATTSSVGAVRPDNTTITISAGVISAASGSGTGNVSGPVSSVTGQIATYTDGTGKLITDSSNITTSQFLYLQPSPTTASTGLNSIFTTGANGAGTFSGDFAYHNLQIASDKLDVGSSNIWGLACHLTFGGSPARGARTALYGLATQTGAVNTVGGQDDYVGIQGIYDGTVSNGGGSGTELGNGFGGNTVGILRAAATHFNNVTGFESDVICAAGSSVKRKTAIQAVYGEGAGLTDSVRGSLVDAVIAVAAGNGPGAAVGVSFSAQFGRFPVGTDGCCIAANDTASVASAIDFSNLSCSTFGIKMATGTTNGIYFASRNMLYSDGSGNLVIGANATSAVAGASLVPGTDNTYSCGSTANRWASVTCVTADIKGTSNADMTLDATSGGGDTWTVRARNGAGGSGFELLDNGSSALYVGPVSTVTPDGQTNINILCNEGGVQVFRTVNLDGSISGKRALYVNG